MRRLILIAVTLAAFGVTLQTAGPAGALTGKSASFTPAIPDVTLKILWGI